MPTYTANAAQTGVQPKGLRVGMVAVTGFYSFATSVTVGTVVQMVKVPAGATPILIQVANSNAGDSGVSVGDGINNARYRAHGTLSAAQGMITLALPIDPYTYSTDDTIDIFVSLASATTAGGAVYLTCLFSMDIQGR